MKKQFKDLLKREVEAIIHFNDVFSGDSSKDYDAELSVTFRNLGTLSDLYYPIGDDASHADYAPLLLNDLTKERRRIQKQIGITHKDTAVISVINNAPRGKKETSGGKNGTDFYLAITSEGVEIYVTPLERLWLADTHNIILALYKIPNEKLEITDGSKEQFRSSIIVTSRHFPHILEPIFEYESVDELIKAKESGTHPQAIQTQQNDAEVVYVDKFGNVRISAINDDIFLNGASKGDSVKVTIAESNIPKTVVMVSSLSEIPEGSVGLYRNIADIQINDPGHDAGVSFWELVKRSNTPSHEKENACAILKEIAGTIKDKNISITKI